MFPFSSVLCQDYCDWLILHNNNSFITNSPTTSSSDKTDTSNGICQELTIEFDYSLQNSCTEKAINLHPYKIAHINNSKDSPINTSISPVHQYSVAHPHPDFQIHCEAPSDEQLQQQYQYPQIAINEDEAHLIKKAVQTDQRSRLLKIQRQRKFVRRRNSFRITKRIQVCKIDNFGMVDFSSSILPYDYLDKFINSWSFNIFRLNRFTGGNGSLIKASMKMFEVHDLINHYKLRKDQLVEFFGSIQGVYHSFNPYHNALHAADVAQAIHCFIIQNKIRKLCQPIDKMSCLIAALCHDADHPGLNQIYLEKINHFFVHLYNHSSVLENHHIKVTMSLLNQSDMLKHSLSSDEWQKMTRTITNMILATDIAHQKSYLNKFTNLVREQKTPQQYTEDDKMLLFQMCLKCSDISNPCRCWPVTLGWATLICEEFFLQGDVEKKLGLTVLPTHDRCMTTKADIQLSFIRFIVRPLMSQWHLFLRSKLSSRLDHHVDVNLAYWEQYKQRYSMVTTLTTKYNLSNSSTTSCISGTTTSAVNATAPCSSTHSACVINDQQRSSVSPQPPQMDTLTEESTMYSALCSHLSNQNITLSTEPMSSIFQRHTMPNPHFITTTTTSGASGGTAAITSSKSGPRRLSLPENMSSFQTHFCCRSSSRILVPSSVGPVSNVNIITNAISNCTPTIASTGPVSTSTVLSQTSRRASLPPQQHHLPLFKSMNNPVYNQSSRRGSLPLNMRGAIPMPSAWEDSNNIGASNNFRGWTGGKSVKPNRTSNLAITTTINQRRGSAPIITTIRGGSASPSCGTGTGGHVDTGLISSCSRERLLLEVYWMAAAAGASSSSVSSCTSLHGVTMVAGEAPRKDGTPSNQGAGGNHSSSSGNSSRHDSGTGTLVIH